MSPCSLIFVAEFACKVVKIEKRECFVSVNEYKAKKQHSQGFGNRSSRSQMFFKIVVFKNFAIFTEKHTCWSLQYTCFPVNNVKLLTHFSPVSHFYTP